MYLTEVGTDNAKELIMSRLRLQPDLALPKPGAIHLPLNEAVCDDTELQQLTAERKIPVRRDGRIVYRWDAGKKRNEALDCFVYALAALYIALERFGIDLEKLSLQAASQESEPEHTQPKPKPQKPKSSESNGWLKTSGGGWL
ncbi:terminase gpA endonuclease subunit [Shewanella sp. JL219SE-S6]